MNKKIAVYIDPPSHHFLNDRLFSYSGQLGDDLMAPYVTLQDFFNKKNIPIHTADLIPDENNDEIKIYLSLGILDNYQKLSKRPDVIVSSFFAMECPIVDPRQYKRMRDAQHYFKHMFSWSDSDSLQRFIGEKINIETFCWPQSYDAVHEKYWPRTDRKFLMMMNSNKLPAIYWQELYTERMRAVQYFSQSNDIDLYGREWNLPSIQLGQGHIPYTFRKIKRDIQILWQKAFPDPLLVAARKVYKGAADSKSEVLSEYNFALCFENMIIKGWVTEKIFDCFFTGTVPIYLGSPDISERIPENCFIDMRQFDDYEKLLSHLKSLTEEDIQTYRDNAKKFLASPAFQPYSKETFAELIVKTIEKDANIFLH